MPNLNARSFSIVDMMKEGVFELLLKAVQFVGFKSNKTILTHFYRNKSPQYFLDIFNKDNGVMKKYIKNMGGDRASAINRRMDGLFFGANSPPPARIILWTTENQCAGVPSSE